MRRFFDWLDRMAVIESENPLARWLERIAFFFLILTVLAAPHSIAATQIAWLTGMFAWFIRLFVNPRPKLVRTPLDIALWAFFGWTVLSSIFSYAPDISADKLRNAMLFLIFYFIVGVARSKRVVIFLAFALVFSCMFNVVWTPVMKIVGRGVEVHGIKTDSPLAKALIYDGDTLLEIDKRKIRAPEDLTAALEENETVTVKFYRPDFEAEVPVKRADLLAGDTALERLGVESWTRSHNWRSSGFYHHYETYAEVLQLIASLVFGLFIASLAGNKFLMPKRAGDARTIDEGTKINASQTTFSRPASYAPPLLLFCLGAMLLALLLTVTRASQLSFLVSAFAILIINGNRKMLLISAALVLPLAFGALLFLQQSRDVGFFDVKDNSITWRETVYHEGLDLFIESPRHIIFGVGMDSIKRYAKDWHLFDDGRLPMGHFHSTPLQLAVERGLPALLLWLWVLWTYARLLWRNLKRETQNRETADWRRRGIILGAFGGLIGFFTSGIVHYNYGDAIVAMMFFILMGLGVKLAMKDESENFRDEI